MTKDVDPIEESRKRQAEIVAEQEAFEKANPPTPTQEEHDRAKLNIGKPDVDAEPAKKRDVEAEKPAAYTTRQAKAD